MSTAVFLAFVPVRFSTCTNTCLFSILLFVSLHLCVISSACCIMPYASYRFCNSSSLVSICISLPETKNLRFPVFIRQSTASPLSGKCFSLLFLLTSMHTLPDPADRFTINAQYCEYIHNISHCGHNHNMC